MWEMNEKWADCYNSVCLYVFSLVWQFVCVFEFGWNMTDRSSSTLLADLILDLIFRVWVFSHKSPFGQSNMRTTKFAAKQHCIHIVFCCTSKTNDKQHKLHQRLQLCLFIHPIVYPIYSLIHEEIPQRSRSVWQETP